MQNQPMSQLALDSPITQSEVWSKRNAQRKDFTFLADLWS